MDGREPSVPVIEQPEPPVSKQITKTLGRHIEATLIAIGFVLGATAAIVAGLIR